MTWRHRIVSVSTICVVVAMVVVAGCGAGSGHAVRHHATAARAPSTRASLAAAQDTTSLACAQSIGLMRPGSSGLHVVLGVVALPTAPTYGALQTSRTGMHGRLRLFAKTGLLIKPNTTFALVVPAGLKSRMAIAWGNAGDVPPSGRLIVNACGRGETTGSRWLAYAGGYYVSHTACVSLVVVAHGRRRRVSLGVGRPCPGQRSPPKPTQS